MGLGVLFSRVAHFPPNVWTTLTLPPCSMVDFVTIRLRSMNKYFMTRGKLVSRVAKYPGLRDYAVLCFLPHPLVVLCCPVLPPLLSSSVLMAYVGVKDDSRARVGGQKTIAEGGQRR